VPAAVGGRGSFYQEVGAIRDLIQNHLLQIVALLAMEPPVGPDDEALRDEKVRVLKSICPPATAGVVRGLAAVSRFVALARRALLHSDG
jgi:glucose-6-phosphate 1-dehydrogenase